MDVKPVVLEWALRRSGMDMSELSGKAGFKRLPKWLDGSASPTLSQLERFSKATHAPFGYLLLSEPPHDTPSTMPHYATGGRTSGRGINLEDAIKFTEWRQDWARDYLVELGADPLPFVKSYDIHDDPVQAAAGIKGELGLQEDWPDARGETDWHALHAKIENSRIFLARTHMVKHHHTRKIDPKECRGFVLSDDYAPFIFLNSADRPDAQIFTLAHALAHVWLGASASFDLHDFQPAPNQLECACSRIAAELLVPTGALVRHWDEFAASDDAFGAISSHFKVGKIVAARRALDAECISQMQFDDFYREYSIFIMYS